MNDRIKELIEQASSCEKGMPNWDMTANTAVYTFDKEKFAKLLIEECLEQLQLENHCTHTDGWTSALEWAAGMIKEHFGIPE